MRKDRKLSGRLFVFRAGRVGGRERGRKNGRKRSHPSPLFFSFLQSWRKRVASAIVVAGRSSVLIKSNLPKSGRGEKKSERKKEEREGGEGASSRMRY